MGEKLGRLFSFMWNILNNERGDAGDLDPPDPGNPDPEPSPGEPDPDPEPEPSPEPEPEPEPSPDPEPEPDPDEPVPVARFNKMYGEKKETERKFDLFKRLGPDKYYEVYPDDKPEEAAGPAETPEVKPMTFSESANMTIEGGVHDGKTLEEVYKDDPFAAIDIYNEYKDGVRANQAETRETTAKNQESVEKEHTEFAEARAKELFGKSTGDLSEAEEVQLHDLMMSVMDKFESLGTYRLDSAYKLLTMDETLKNARGESIKGLIEAARKGKVTHISNKKGIDTISGYEGMMEFTPGQLSAYLRAMNGAEKQVFWSKAPKSFVAQHKSMAEPWV